ncbi:GIY-YIG nuclease family protein, partial [bacterium]|nr:GIY-YIG nuclease family protein [bacterium]
MYYVYELIDPRVNLPFYVGKGKGNRVYFHLSEQSRAKSDNFKKFDKIKKIRKEGYEPEVKIVKYFEEENDAYDYEEELIKKYGKRDIDEGGILT